MVCGIGSFSDTLEDRSVWLELRRKKPGESVEKLRHSEPGLFGDLRSKIARFVEDKRETIRTAQPKIPESLNDRAGDNAEPLLAIADTAGGNWPELAQKAMEAIFKDGNATESLGNELLADIQSIFEANPTAEEYQLSDL